MKGKVVGIPERVTEIVGDLVLETVILYVLVDKRVVASADGDGVLETDMVWVIDFVKGKVVGIPERVILILGDLDMETVILVVLVAIMVVGIADLVTETV